MYCIIIKVNLESYSTYLPQQGLIVKLLYACVIIYLALCSHIKC